MLRRTVAPEPQHDRRGVYAGRQVPNLNIEGDKLMRELEPAPPVEVEPTAEPTSLPQ